jgi:TIR domain
MAEIFISYKSDRRNAAKHLAGVLTRYGYSVWFDYALIKGDDFELQLDSQLRTAKAVIVLWCPMSVQSAWVSREASLASKLKTLLPVLIEDCELKLAHHTSDYVDLIEWDGSPRSHTLDPLLNAVTRLVGRPPQADWAKLREYEENWRMFGSPSLAAFALGKPIELPTIEPPTAGTAEKERAFQEKQNRFTIEETDTPVREEKQQSHKWQAVGLKPRVDSDASHVKSHKLRIIWIVYAAIASILLIGFLSRVGGDRPQFTYYHHGFGRPFGR